MTNTELELLKQIRRFDGNLSREQNQRYYVLETKIETLQAEHKALKKDVARYFELFELQSDEVAFPTEYLFTDDDWRELNFLEEKLSKVGKE